MAGRGHAGEHGNGQRQKGSTGNAAPGNRIRQLDAHESFGDVVHRVGGVQPQADADHPAQHPEGQSFGQDQAHDLRFERPDGAEDGDLPRAGVDAGGDQVGHAQGGDDQSDHRNDGDEQRGPANVVVDVLLEPAQRAGLGVGLARGVAHLEHDQLLAKQVPALGRGQVFPVLRHEERLGEQLVGRSIARLGHKRQRALVAQQSTLGPGSERGLPGKKVVQGIGNRGQSCGFLGQARPPFQHTASDGRGVQRRRVGERERLGRGHRWQV